MIGSRLDFDTFIGEQYMQNEFIKVSCPQQHIHVLKDKYHKKMTIKIRDMEITILVLAHFLWPNHFIVLNCVVLA